MGVLAMSTKSNILKILEQNRGQSVSGESLAQELYISRNAIWKAINELRQDGYVIKAVTNKGYVFEAENDIISAEGIKTYIENKHKLSDIYVYSSLTSTNTEAKRLACNGAKDKTVIISNEQTAGRGRMGRSFFSPCDAGIYMSVILRPALNVIDSGLVTTAASVAVCRAITKLYNHLSPKIKWVNDILLDGKKVCGILTEAGMDFESGTVEYVIVGIGINISTNNFPDALKPIATTLKGSEVIPRNRITAKILHELFSITDNLNVYNFMDEYKQYSAVLGKDIEIIHGDMRSFGKAIDINENGGLVARLHNGTIVTLTSGEISIRGDFYAQH